MSDTAEQKPGSSSKAADKDVSLNWLKHTHHAAYRCRDAEQTRWFYEDVMGLKLAAAMVFDDDPSSGKKRDYMHLFFQLADGNFIAFFDAPDDVDESMFVARHGFDQHIAFECETMQELKAWRRKINKAGRPCFGPINHDFIHSIYMYDPNGIQVEITVKDENYEQILADDAAQAHATLAAWTEKTRATKLERTNSEALDLRGIDMAKVDMSKVKLKKPDDGRSRGE